ncbi:rRNA pseudouridine synthase [Candidatus Dependentiae bacterium]|nr:rRNA pseudouridine synthase [Candidatus Dependentiae bacterium]
MILNKFLAQAGICSRRKAVELIKSGKVTVNHFPILEPGYMVRETDVVRYNKRVVKPEEKIYILLNKPTGYISTVSDEHDRNTVFELIEKAQRGHRLYPIGRLDRDTTGLLILTNDGDLAQQLAHPRYNVQKVYQVMLDQALRNEDMQKISAGLKLEDGKITVDHIVYIPKKPHTHIRVTLHSGKNRIVRRIFEHLGYQVIALDRIKYAGLTIRNLPRGGWRKLTEQEIIKLKQYS